MSQPTYDLHELIMMSDESLAAELEQWAEAREHVSQRRNKIGKESLDTSLLREAARRLRKEP